MDVNITKHENVTTVAFVGRLDTPSAQTVTETIAPVMEAADGTVVLDCKDMTYISSSGLRIFLALRKTAAAQGGKVIVKDINNDIRQVFMMTGFLSLFDIQ
ncbi:MAG: STAS domain-containing protein [Bacteroidales bacterium]|nr:STAS domain-containing protein [Bacteroidales bacterium]